MTLEGNDEPIVPAENVASAEALKRNMVRGSILMVCRR